MTKTESDDIIRDVRACYDQLTTYSSKAQPDAFLGYYDNGPGFLSIAADGKLNNWEEFRAACHSYYNALREQTIETIRIEFRVLDTNHVLVAWTGNILATFRNGDVLKTNHYSVTSVFRKTGEQWKIIHDHESGPPPAMIKHGMKISSLS